MLLAADDLLIREPREPLDPPEPSDPAEREVFGASSLTSRGGRPSFLKLVPSDFRLPVDTCVQMHMHVHVGVTHSTHTHTHTITHTHAHSYLSWSVARLAWLRFSGPSHAVVHVCYFALGHFEISFFWREI